MQEGESPEKQNSFTIATYLDDGPAFRYVSQSFIIVKFLAAFVLRERVSQVQTGQRVGQLRTEACVVFQFFTFRRANAVNEARITFVEPRLVVLVFLAVDSEVARSGNWHQIRLVVVDDFDCVPGIERHKFICQTGCLGDADAQKRNNGDNSKKKAESDKPNENKKI